MKIIVPIDFSTTSYNAFTTAKKFAKATGGEITLVHIIEPPSASFSSMGKNLEDKMDDAFISKLIEKVDYELKILQEANTDVSLKIIRKIGKPFQEVKRLILVEMADLVVIGDKGVVDDEDIYIGSLTDKIVRTSKCPVLTVNQEVNENSLGNLLYATDLKEEHPKLVALLKEIQVLFDAQIHIVKINTRNNYSNDVDTMTDLHKLVEKYQIKNYTLAVYNHEDEEFGIAYYANEVKADLIAMGIHQTSGLRRLIKGANLAENVSEQTYRPILTFPHS